MNTSPPAPSPASALSFTGIIATPCSNTQTITPLNSINLVIPPYIVE